MITNNINDSVSFDAKRITEKTKVCFFCFPPAGGSISKFNKWNDILSDEIAVLPITLPGHERRIEEKPISRLMPIVKSIAFELRKFTNLQYVFYGECLGGLFAYEVSLEVMKAYNKKPLHLYVLGVKAPHLIYIEEPIHILDDCLFIENLKKNNSIPKEVLLNQELMNIILPGLKADFQIYETYNYKHIFNIDFPLSILVGNKHVDFTEEDALNWNQVSKNKVNIISYEGDHFSMTDDIKVITDIERYLLQLI